MVEKIPTLYSNYNELLLDISIYSKTVSIPQLDISDKKEMLFEEFKRQNPIPTMEIERYKLSDLISTDYKITYEKQLELQENENLIEFENAESSSVDIDIDFESLDIIPQGIKSLFYYENNVTDADREAIIAKYDLASGDEFDIENSKAEEVFNTVQRDESSILSDEQIENMINQTEVDNKTEDNTEIQIDDGIELDIPIDTEEEIEEIEEDDEDFDEDETELEEDEEDETKLEEDFDEDETELEEYEEDEEDFNDDEEEFDEDEEDFDEDEEYETELEEDDEDEEEDIIPQPKIVETAQSTVDDEEYEEDTEEEYEEEDEEDEYDEETEEVDIEEEEMEYEEEEVEEDESVTTINPQIEQKTPSFVDSILEDDTDEDDIEFITEENRNRVIETPKVQMQPVEVQVKTEERPTDLRQFLRTHPRCEYSEALKYFSEKEIKDMIRKGKVIKKGNTLRI